MKPSHTPDELAELAAALTLKRRDAELDLLGVIYADPARGVPIAEAAGIVHHCFADEDTKALWLTASVGRDQSPDDILRLAAKAIKHFGHWDDRQIAGNFGSMTWGYNSLVFLAESWPFSPDTVTILSARVLAVELRDVTIRQLYDRMIRLLRGTEDVVVSESKPTQTKPQFVVRVVKRGAA